MSTALYRRYRPETFAEVIGQEHVTVPLCAALARDRVNHAYLFSGPRGCGKTTSARILARCLNCEQGPTPTPCGVCASCIDLARGGPGSLDVVEIDAASHGGVDDARTLRERAVFAPARDRYKVFIIDEAHMVSTQGFNALLKIVEEPPPHVRFVFATTEPEKVIGTIRSRTHHYPFRLVPPERLQTYLAQLCEAEGAGVGQGVLPLVVRAGAGSVRDSLSVLDQLIAGSGDDGLTYPLAVSLLGYTDAALLDEVADGLAAGDGRAVFGVVDRVIETGHDPRRFVEDLLERMRDLLVVAAVPDGGHGVLRGLPADQFERMKGQAARFGRAELSRAADVVNTALTDMTGATSPRLQLELLVARLLLPGAEDSERGLRSRVDRIEKRIGVVAPGVPLSTPVAVPPSAAPRPAAPVPAPVAPAVPAPVAPVAPVAPAVPASVASSSRAAPPGDGVDTVRRMWSDVLDKLRGLRRMTWTLVSEYAQVFDVSDGRLLLLFDSPGRASSFGRGSHAEYVRQALIDVIGLDVRVEAVSGEVSRSPASAAPVVTRPAAARPNPGPANPGPANPGPANPGPAGQAAAPGPPPVPPAGPPLEEPPGWGPPSAVPGGSATGSVRGAPDQPASRPEQRPEPPPDTRPAAPGALREEPRRDGLPARPMAERPGSTGSAGGAGRFAGRRPPAPPRDDVPLPDEPPAEEPPPEDDFDPYAQPVGRLSTERPVRAVPRPAVTDPSPQSPAAPAAGASGRGTSSAANEISLAAGPVPPSRYAALRAAVPTAQRTALRRPEVQVVVTGDEPSADDPDVEDSGLVGPPVVAQLLGGRVIEERTE